MISLRAFRDSPHFAPLFAHVPVFCWPILWWQLNALLRYCRREGIPDALYSVNDWGFITVRHFGARPDPAAYKPLERTFRPLTDVSWGSDVPACLEVKTPQAKRTRILPRAAGGGGSRQRRETEAAPSSNPDTS